MRLPGIVVPWAKISMWTCSVTVTCWCLACFVFVFEKLWFVNNLINKKLASLSNIYLSWEHFEDHKVSVTSWTSLHSILIQSIKYFLRYFSQYEINKDKTIITITFALDRCLLFKLSFLFLIFFEIFISNIPAFMHLASSLNIFCFFLHSDLETNFDLTFQRINGFTSSSSLMRV